MKFIHAHHTPKKRHQEADDAVGDVALDELVVQRGRRLGDGDDEAQVEEQLERGRRADAPPPGRARRRRR